MKKTFYFLSNKSSSAGQYLIDDEYVYLNPGCDVILERKPTNWTENIVLSIFRRDVADEVKQSQKKSEVKQSKSRTTKGE